jgi:predicted alpha/beta-hydrolase family hydrolase
LENVVGLVLFAFPLHPPGAPDTKRADHLSKVTIPMLFLSGTRDPLGELDLLEPVIGRLGEQAKLHLLETAGHSFKVLKRTRTNTEDVFDEMARVTAEWAQTL